MAGQVSSVVPFEQSGDGSAPSVGISDAQFVQQVTRLKSLSYFLSQEGIALPLPDTETTAIGTLFTLVYHSEGRSPSADEWAALIKCNRLLFQPLTEVQRRRFLLGHIPSRVAHLPLLFAMLALAALMACVLIPQFYSGSIDATKYKIAAMPFYLVWLMSMGAIGSIAFIGMNALLVQEDITFDLLNTRLISLRIALGSTFALVLAAPFAHDGFMKFLQNVLLIKENTSLNVSEGLALILPFVLGFSTSVVITILNRFIEASQTFFGHTPKSKVAGTIKAR